MNGYNPNGNGYNPNGSYTPGYQGQKIPQNLNYRPAGYPQQVYPPQGYPVYTPPQKKKSKTPFVLLTVFIVGALLAALVCFYVYNTAEKELASDDSFYFYDDVGNDEVESSSSLTVEELKSYSPKYLKYNSTVYFSTLSENEKLIYKAITYAFDNCNEVTFIPDAFLPESEGRLEDILYFIALDSPLIEQNIVNAQETTTTEISVRDGLGFEHKKNVDGAVIYVENFSDKKFEYKLKAVEAAEALSAALPAELTTDREKAEFFFNHLVRNSEYVNYNYDDIENINFLYDTLVSYKSNCDGFTNSFSLLCNMNGISCFEKMVNGVDDAEGHTWNCIVLDGKYYNVDVTSSLDVEPEYIAMYFCYPDKYSSYGVEYADSLPVCDDDSLSMFDCYITSESDNEAVNILFECYKNNSRKYVLAFFTELDSARVERIVDKFLYRITTGVSYVTEEDTGTGCHTLLIIPD